MVNPKIDALLTEATVEIKKPDGEGVQTSIELKG
jgi:hypothetical protein